MWHGVGSNLWRESTAVTGRPPVQAIYRSGGATASLCRSPMQIAGAVLQRAHPFRRALRSPNGDPLKVRDVDLFDLDPTRRHTHALQEQPPLSDRTRSAPKVITNGKDPVVDDHSINFD